MKCRLINVGGLESERCVQELQSRFFIVGSKFNREEKVNVIQSEKISLFPFWLSLHALLKAKTVAV